MTGLTIQPVAPFRLDFSSWAIRRRAHNAMDVWDDKTGTHRRSVVLGETPTSLHITQTGGPDAPELTVRLGGDQAAGPARAAVLETEARDVVTRLFGLDIDLSPFYELAAPDPVLGPIAAGLRGVKPPRYPTAFEGLVNAITCQQISLDAGMHVLNRLSAAHGLPVEGDSDAPPVFPGPEQLAPAEPEDLRQLGYSHSKGRTIIEASRKVVTGDLDLEGLAELPDDQALAQLLSLWGVGRWTAEYVLLRGLGRVHVFPGDDVGAHNKLRALYGVTTAFEYDSVIDLVSRWHPYAGLVYFHFLLDSLIEGPDPDGRNLGT